MEFIDIEDLHEISLIPLVLNFIATKCKLVGIVTISDKKEQPLSGKVHVLMYDLHKFGYVNRRLQFVFSL